jgi:hypothetical protein
VLNHGLQFLPPCRERSAISNAITLEPLEVAEREIKGAKAYGISGKNLETSDFKGAFYFLSVKVAHILHMKRLSA